MSSSYEYMIKINILSEFVNHLYIYYQMERIFQMWEFNFQHQIMA